MTRRFYEEASVAAKDNGFVVKLDSHELKTPAKAPLILPTEEMAQLVADDWAAQEETIDSSQMLFMRLVSTAQDRVSTVIDETAEAFAAYGMSDLLCYRADNPQRLVDRQAEAWDPLLEWARSRYDMSFEVTTGVLPVSQPIDNEARLAAIAGRDAYRLTGLAHVSALLGSAILTLALDEAHIDAEQAYQLAFLDDLYQIDEWGSDEEAEQRLEKIALEIQQSARYLSALSSDSGEE